jgi:propane 2-monooxygenase small subunit
MMHAQRYGYTQMINTAILTNSSYKLRFAQDLTLYLAEIALDLNNFDTEAGKKHWVEDPLWQSVRKAVETIMGTTDYLEQYFATNLVFEPLVGELFRSGFVMQIAAAQNDFMTPAVVSAAEGDYERNLANTVELCHLLAIDPQYGAANTALFGEWLAKHGALAREAASTLQPVWSLPRVKAAPYTDALEQARNRLRAIGTAVGFDVRPAIEG